MLNFSGEGRLTVLGAGRWDRGGVFHAVSCLESAVCLVYRPLCHSTLVKFKKKNIVRDVSKAILNISSHSIL